MYVWAFPGHPRESTNRGLITAGRCCEEKLLLRSFYGQRFGTCNHAVLPASSQGKLSEAESPYERCQTIEEKVLGLDHPCLAVTLNNRAVLLKDKVRAIQCLNMILAVLVYRSIYTIFIVLLNRLPKTSLRYRGNVFIVFIHCVVEQEQ